MRLARADLQFNHKWPQRETEDAEAFAAWSEAFEAVSGPAEQLDGRLLEAPARKPEPKRAGGKSVGHDCFSIAFRLLFNGMPRFKMVDARTNRFSQFVTAKTLPVKLHA